MTTSTLSEAASKTLLSGYGIPFAEEIVADTAEEAVRAAQEIGYPVVVKLSGAGIAHKTERGLVKLNLRSDSDVAGACSELIALTTTDDGDVSFLVAEMVKGERELIIGVVSDPQFGSMVLLGIGGIFAEVINDVAIRQLPISQPEAVTMINDLMYQSILGEFRGSQAVDRSQLADIVVQMGNVMTEHPLIASLDINPLIIRLDGSCVAVDALVEIGEAPGHDLGKSNKAFTPTPAHFEALFNPRGIVVVGASSHPGKFGFVSLHNVLVNNYQGNVFATNLQQERILDTQTVASVIDLPPGQIDLAFFCTPAAINEQLLRDCASIGIKSVFIASAGYRESGDAGAVAEDALLHLANSLNVLIAGPNGQGVISTPPSLCLQIVAPFPPAGHISIASQSGNFVSSFLNYSRQSGVGIARAISAGNATQIGIAQYLDYFGTDDATHVGLTYIESADDGLALSRAMHQFTAKKPLVVLKGGSTDAGSRAAQSHTGAMASDDRIFSGVMKSIGATKVDSVEDAFDIAAAFATQPLPRGNRVAILTTAGGWGVVTADALARNGVLQLTELSEDLMAKLSDLLPPRWSRNNPIDCAGGETRDTVTEIMDIVASHNSVDAVIFLGIGIQSNQARMMREGKFFPAYGLERIVNYHETQDARYAEQARAVSKKYDKPVLVATELAVADPANPGPRTAQLTGSYCFPTGARAVASLAELFRYARYRGVVQ